MQKARAFPALPVKQFHDRPHFRLAVFQLVQPRAVAL
jgi:hypothetical protein